MCPQEFHPIWFWREKSRRESKAGEEGVNRDCENHKQGILPAMENAMEIREDMEEACVLTNLTCTALAPSKISSTTFLEIESISRSTLLTGESGGLLSVPWSAFTLTGGQTHHPSGLAIRKIKFLAIIYYYIYILTITAHVVCVVRPFLALARREDLISRWHIRKSSHTLCS